MISSEDVRVENNVNLNGEGKFDFENFKSPFRDLGYVFTGR